MSACMDNSVAHAQQEWPNCFQIGQLSSYPKNEFAFRRRHRRAGYRRVDETNIAARCFGDHFLRERRIYRAAIDPNCMWPEVIQKSIIAQSCLLDRAWIG